MKRRRILYGWLRVPGEWCLSRVPPDVPAAYTIFSSMEEAEETARRSRYHVIWSGPAACEKQAADTGRVVNLHPE
jgi:hypothetical protein